jgi:cell division protein ZapA
MTDWNMAEKKKLKIKIFDKEYSLLVDNEEIGTHLASYVNKIMEETRRELPDQSAQTIAIISALNIAYDLFLERNNFKEFNANALDRIKKIKLQLNESQIPNQS